MVGRTHAKLNGTLVYGASCTMSYLAVDQERRVTMTQKYTVFMVLILGVIQAYTEAAEDVRSGGAGCRRQRHRGA